MEIKKITTTEFLKAYVEKKAKWSSKQIKKLIDTIGADFDKCYTIVSTDDYLALRVKAYKEGDKLRFPIDDYGKNAFTANEIVKSSNLEWVDNKSI